MPKRTVLFRVEHAGHADTSRVLAPDEVAQAMTALDGQRDVTVTIDLQGAGERVMIGIDGSSAFLALERPDGLFQFVADDAATGTRELAIGGQPTELKNRYLLDVATTSAVVTEWLERGEDSSHGYWERR
jgi:hypothetical protein